MGATADTEAILEDTLDVREELDITLRNHFRDNPAKLVEWLTASHNRTLKEKDRRAARERTGNTRRIVAAEPFKIKRRDECKSSRRLICFRVNLEIVWLKI